MASRWKSWGFAALALFFVVLLWRRRRSFRGARGLLLLFRILVAVGEAWREASWRRRVAMLEISSPGVP
jgi:hypothetical protein